MQSDNEHTDMLSAVIVIVVENSDLTFLNNLLILNTATDTKR